MERILSHFDQAAYSIREDEFLSIFDEESDRLLGERLDTIAQLPTVVRDYDFSAADIRDMQQFGSELSAQFESVRQPLDSQFSQLKKRVGYKLLTNSYLIWMAHNSQTELRKSYYGSLLCNDTIRVCGPNVSSTFCNQRACLTCAKRRSMKNILKYGSTLETWPEKQFVTLTIPNVPADRLKETMRGMVKSASNCVETLRRRRKLPMQGLRKLECTHNGRRNDYHPHFHFIVENEAQAHELLAAWMKQHPAADMKGQDIRAANDNSTIELFKYFTKIVTKATRDDGRTVRYVDPNALDTIFNACVGSRVFQPFGFKAQPIDKEKRMFADVETNFGERMLMREYAWKQGAGRIPGWYDLEDFSPLLPDFAPNRQTVRLAASSDHLQARLAL